MLCIVKYMKIQRVVNTRHLSLKRKKNEECLSSKRQSIWHSTQVLAGCEEMRALRHG
jgi:hypothetical protein